MRQSSAVKKSALKTSRARSTGNGRSVSFSLTLSVVRFKIEVGCTLRRRHRSWRGSQFGPQFHCLTEVALVRFRVREERGGEKIRAEEVYTQIAKLRERFQHEQRDIWTKVWNRVQELDAAWTQANETRKPEIAAKAELQQKVADAAVTDEVQMLL